MAEQRTAQQWFGAEMERQRPAELQIELTDEDYGIDGPGIRVRTRRLGTEGEWDQHGVLVQMLESWVASDGPDAMAYAAWQTLFLALLEAEVYDVADAWARRRGAG